MDLVWAWLLEIQGSEAAEKPPITLLSHIGKLKAILQWHNTNGIVNLVCVCVLEWNWHHKKSESGIAGKFLHV